MLTPVDIENKVFKKVKIGGYDINEVEDFLEEVIVDYENLYKENLDLKNKLEKSEETGSYFNTLENSVSKTIENSQKTADTIKDEAMLESEKIKDDAKFEAEKIRNDATMDAVRIRDDASIEAKKIREEAEEKAKEIIEKAKEEADNIKPATQATAPTPKVIVDVEEIKLEIRAKELELEKIKKEMQIYKIKAKSMLEAQLEIINDDNE